MRYEEYVKIQLGKLCRGGVAAAGKIPTIGLYMDQAEQFFQQQTAEMDGEKIRRFLSKTAINNYTKNSIIPRPAGKKYSDEHMVMILMAAYLKGIFKLEEVRYLMKPLVDNFESDFDESIDPKVIYQVACETVKDYAENLTTETDAHIEQIKKQFGANEMDDDERAEVLTLILSLAMRADMDKYLASRLMEQYFITPATEKPEKPRKQKK